MPTEHCKECTAESECGNGHLYVIEFLPEVAETYAKKDYKGYLYVGKTRESVETRGSKTFRLVDGTQYEPGEVTNSDELQDRKDWHYNTPNMRRIRKYFWRYRPDLFYFGINPIKLDNLSDPNRLDRREANLADKLRNRGYRVEGPSLM